METIDTTTGIWLIDDAGTPQYCIDSQLCNKLIEILNGVSVIDLGCGFGFYVKRFLETGIHAVGFDGNPYTKQITNGVCGIVDLSRMFRHNDSFDVCLSLEVGEHIPKEFEQVFIENLVHNCNHKIILSWAIDGQGGFGHVNCQNNGYIIDRMTERNLVYNQLQSEELRNSASISWFKDTIMVFDKK